MNERGVLRMEEGGVKSGFSCFLSGRDARAPELVRFEEGGE